MKCEIVRDLLPSYIDGLTSPESNQEIEAHLKTCIECKEITDSMKTEITQEDIIQNKQKIKPFKKLNRRVAKAVLITLLICLLAAASYFYFFAFGWGVNSEDVTVTYSFENGTLDFEFELTTGNVLNAWTNHRDLTEQPGFHSEIKFTQCFHSFLDDRGEEPDKFSYGLTLPEFSETDCLTLKFKNETIVYNLKEITEELQ